MTTTEQRKNQIMEILNVLHKKGSFEEAKRLFSQTFDNVDVLEITSAEKSLIREGLDPEEIQKLCNIHVAAFSGSIDDIHKTGGAYSDPSHPVYIFNLENQILKSLVTDEIDDLVKKSASGNWQKKERLITAIRDLRQVDKHYRRKEQLIFTRLEKYDNNEPPQVMQAADDRIRLEIDDLVAYVQDPQAEYEILQQKWEKVKTDLEKMIVREEEIMLPKLLETFTPQDWEKISQESFAIGFAYIPKPSEWEAHASIKAPFSESPLDDFPDEVIKLPTGKLSLSQLVGMLQVLPLSLTFFDEKDYVCFFSSGTQPVFPRSQTDIGRKAVYLPGPADLAKVLDDFHAGKKEQADFSIKEKQIIIRYYALKDESDQYMGCVEWMQDLNK